MITRRRSRTSAAVLLVLAGLAAARMAGGAHDPRQRRKRLAPNTNGAGAGFGDSAVLTIEINGNGKGCLVLFGGAIRFAVSSSIVVGEPACSRTSGGATTSIAGNFIGVNVAGTEPLPNETGVLLGGDLEVVGGATPETRAI